MNSITDITPLKLNRMVSNDNDNDTSSNNASLSFSNFKNMLRRSFDISSLEMNNSTNQDETTPNTSKSDTTANQSLSTLNATDSNNLSKLKFNFQSLDLYNRLNGPNRFVKKKALDVDDDESTKSNPSTNSLILKSSIYSNATRSTSTTPTQTRKRLSNAFLTMTGARVYLRVLYDSNTHVLTVSIIQTNKLVKNQPNDSKQKQLFGSNKIQFHLSLLNKDKSPKYKSSVKEFAELIDLNETFYFPNIQKHDLNNDSILLSVYTKEIFTSDKLILQASYLLSNLTLNEQFNYITLYLEKPHACSQQNLDSTSPMNYNRVLVNSNGERAQLYLGLKYDSIMGILTVNIIKGSNLYDPITSDKNPNTYVKLLLKLEETQTKHETASKRSTSQPIFDEIFEFSIATFQVENAELFIYVYSKRVLSGKNLIGYISFDDKPGNDEYLKHLKEAFTESDTGEFINRWHSLLTC